MKTSKVGERVTIHRGGKVVARSWNLRGIFDYGRRNGIEAVLINPLWRRKGGRLQVRFDDGAVTSVEFADYNVLKDFVKSRRSWPEAEVVSRGTTFRQRIASV